MLSGPPRRPCRCLTAEMPEGKALAELIRERIAGIPPEERTPEAEYGARLAVCKSCGRLRDGTCALCGCYVEIRAARRGQRCPAVPAKWETRR